MAFTLGDMHVRRQEWRQVALHTNGAHAGTATAVRNCKCLMEVQVTNISANEAGSREAHLCVHVRTVHVYLSAVLMHYLRNFLYRLFEYPIRRRVGDHDTRQVFG